MDNSRAFPAGWPEAGYEPHYGMTLLDYFAGQALPAVMHLCARDTLEPGETREQSFARKSYSLARAMLTARQENSDGH